jgi:hypothetical protein
VGLRRLAVTQTACFGYYAERASTCTVCPLARHCAASVLTALAEIGSNLDEQTEKEIDEAIKQVEAAKLAASRHVSMSQSPMTSSNSSMGVPPASIPQPSSNFAPPASGSKTGWPSGHSEVTLPFDGVCSICGGKINKGDKAIHVAGKGVLHEECARKTSGT